MPTPRPSWDAAIPAQQVDEFYYIFVPNCKFATRALRDPLEKWNRIPLCCPEQRYREQSNEACPCAMSMANLVVLGVAALILPAAWPCISGCGHPGPLGDRTEYVIVMGLATAVCMAVGWLPAWANRHLPDSMINLRIRTIGCAKKPRRDASTDRTDYERLWSSDTHVLFGCKPW